jgi:hypothetical protein
MRTNKRVKPKFEKTSRRRMRRINLYAHSAAAGFFKFASKSALD